MLPKPKSCEGCPFYGDGQGFVPDLLNDQAAVFIVAQNPGEDEEKGQSWDGNDYTPVTPQPLVGKTGHLMNYSYLPVAGLSREQVSLGNAIRCRYNHENKLPPLDHKNVREAMAHCHTAHFKLPEKTKLIVATGDYALYSMTQEGFDKYNKISDWRGYLLPFAPLTGPKIHHNNIYNPTRDGGLPVLASFHLSFTFNDPTAGLVTKLDWRKIGQVLSGKWPRPLPTIQNGPPQVWPSRSAFDTEYNPSNKKFLCYSLAYPSARGDGSLVLRVSEKLEPSSITGKPRVVMQNALADLPFLEKMLAEFDYDDIMHAHAVLWSDFPHDLGFMGSLYSSLNRWKHLSELNPIIYSAGDAYATWEINEELAKEFERDPQSRRIYQDIQLRLVPIIRAAENRGIRINAEAAEAAYTKRQTVLDDLALRAQAATGWPINLRSNDQVKHQLYAIEGLLRLV